MDFSGVPVDRGGSPPAVLFGRGQTMEESSSSSSLREVDSILVVVRRFYPSSHGKSLYESRT